MKRLSKRVKINLSLESIPEVVSGKYGTIADLYVEPVSYKNGIFDIMREFIFSEDLKD